MYKLLLLTLIVPFLYFTSADAQRGVTYQNLVERSDRPNIYVDYLVLPGMDGQALFTASFRMDYDLLPFRRVRPGQDKPSEESEYFATARMNMEIFRGSSESRRHNLQPVTRNTWTDTSWVETFEMTRSRSDHLEGAMTSKLDTDTYSVFLDLNRDGQQRGARSRERIFEVPDFKASKKGVLALLESSANYDDSIQIRLLNYGENVLYGDDYQLMILLPAESSHESYNLKVERLRSGSDSQTEGSPLLEKVLNRDEALLTDGFSQVAGSKKPYLVFNKKDDGFPVLITDIPNSEYPNARFKLTVTPAGENEPIASRTVNSRWIDMPVSLLNVDVAIDMLRFIVDDDQLRRMKRGSSSDRERNFREFWAQRDPTPETEFNELMAEYYHRIDYAYNNFTTPERPGFESDQGRAYILFGEPVRKERTFPTDGPTREFWVYRGRTLIFEATSGFGDFRLIGEQ
jgi:GWxTD domain-containing protein